MVLNNTNKNNSILLEVFASVFTVSSYFTDNPRICNLIYMKYIQNSYILHAYTFIWNSCVYDSCVEMTYFSYEIYMNFIWILYVAKLAVYVKLEWIFFLSVTFLCRLRVVNTNSDTRGSLYPPHCPPSTYNSPLPSVMYTLSYYTVCLTLHTYLLSCGEF